MATPCAGTGNVPRHPGERDRESAEPGVRIGRCSPILALHFLRSDTGVRRYDGDFLLHRAGAIKPEPLKTAPYVACNKDWAQTAAYNEQEASMAHVNSRVQKHRDALRMAGLRPVQIWVPDTRRPDFAEECRRQCLLVAQSDSADMAMQQFMDEALTDVDGWTE